MKIGELAAATATPVETIRYYERIGLLARAPRSAGNYRLYGAAQAERLAFVRHCRSLDMSLDEIRLLLRFKDAPQADCAEVNALLDRHICEVAARIDGLQRLQGQLQALRQQCGGTQAAGHCGILHGLGGHAAGSPAPAGAGAASVRAAARTIQP